MIRNTKIPILLTIPITILSSHMRDPILPMVRPHALHKPIHIIVDCFRAKRLQSGLDGGIGGLDGVVEDGELGGVGGVEFGGGRDVFGVEVGDEDVGGAGGEEALD